MSDESPKTGFHVDDDWKTEAAREKERLAAQERAQEKSKPGTSPDAPPGFMELINLVAMQAIVGLGGLQGPGGERIPPNPVAAKHHIDLLEVLQEKTKGNLSDEEKTALETILYELRMQYVQSVSVPPPPAAGQGKQADS